MTLKNRKALVSGAGGFIGSHLVEELVKRGIAVRAFVRYNSRSDCGLLDFLPEKEKTQIDYFFGDLKDPESVRRAVKGTDVVFHLGALVSIPYSYQDPMNFVQTNVEGTANVLNASRELGVEKIIHTSTSEVYGTAKYTPIDEEHPLQGQSPYSASKIGADKLVRSYYRAFDLPVTVIRPFNTYGPRQSTRAIIPTIITQALTKKEIKLGSLYPRRDFTFVKDTANGFIKMAESSDNLGSVINVGYGEDISIEELAKEILSIVGRDVSIDSEDKRIRPEKSEVDQLLCDNTKAKQIIDWEPSYSFREGLKQTIHWYKTMLNESPSFFHVGEYNV